MEKLQKKINYLFQNPNTLRQALTHSSYTNELTIRKIMNNERLEFLGDAVLELVASEYLFRLYPDKPEGDLTRLRANLVCESSLALSARKIGLGEYLLLGKGENATGGKDRDSIISDAMEALIGAIYLDGGLLPAKEFTENFVLSNLNEMEIANDHKTVLQELVQGRRMPGVTYQTIRETGPDHDKTFAVAAYVGDEKMGCGQGKSKKAAEQEAAYRTIRMIVDQ